MSAILPTPQELYPIAASCAQALRFGFLPSQRHNGTDEGFGDMTYADINATDASSSASSSRTDFQTNNITVWRCRGQQGLSLILPTQTASADNVTAGNKNTGSPLELKNDTSMNSRREDSYRWEARWPGEWTSPPTSSTPTALHPQDAVPNTTSAWTLSLWFKPANPVDTSTSLQPMLTVTTEPKKTFSPSSSSAWITGCRGYATMVAQQQANLIVSFQEEDQANSCRWLVLPGLFTPNNKTTTVSSDSQLHHLVCIWTARTLTVYMNGQARVQDAPITFDVSGSNWKSLVLFGRDPSALDNEDDNDGDNTNNGHVDYSYFRGSLFEMAWWDQPLNASQVAQVYGAGIMEPLTPAPTPFVVNVQTLSSAWLAQDSAKALPLWLSVSVTSQPPLQGIGDDDDDIMDSPFLSTSLWSCLGIQIQSLPRFGIIHPVDAPDRPFSIQDVVMLTPMNSSVTSWSNSSTFSPESEDLGLWVQYTLRSDDYFNVPNVDAYGRLLDLPEEGFDVAAVWLATEASNINSHGTCHDDGLAVTFRPPSRQAIHVVHVNHPPLVQVPSNSSIEIRNASLSSSAKVAVLTGLGVNDAQDLNLNVVRIDLSCSRGLLSLHDPSWLYAVHPGDDLNNNSTKVAGSSGASCWQRTASAWQCSGQGGRDRSLTFLAIPGDVPRILDQLVYESLWPGAADQIILRVHDGVGDSCLTASEHEYYDYALARRNASSSWPTLFRNTCYVVEGVLEIPNTTTALLSAQQHGANNEGDLGRGGGQSLWQAHVGHFGLPELLFWVLVAMLVSCCCSLCGLFRRCLARGGRNKIHVENGGRGAEEEDDDPVSPWEGGPSAV